MSCLNISHSIDWLLTDISINSIFFIFIFIFFSSSSLSLVHLRLLIKASGAGDYWGTYEGVRCKVYFKGLPYQKVNDERIYLSVETVKMDFSVKDITMGVENDNNNKVIRKYFHIGNCRDYDFDIRCPIYSTEAAMNLFINSNAQELLKEMKPQLKEKLTVHLTNFMENLFSKIPFDEWVE